MADLTAAVSSLPVIHHKQPMKASSPTRYAASGREPITLRNLRNKHLRYMNSVKKEQNQLEKEISRIKTVLDPRDYRRASKARRRRNNRNHSIAKAKLGLDMLNDSRSTSESSNSLRKKSLPVINEYQRNGHLAKQTSEEPCQRVKYNEMDRNDEGEWFNATPKNTFDMMLLQKKRDQRRTIYKILLEECDLQEQVDDVPRHLQQQDHDQNKKYNTKGRRKKDNLKVEIGEVRELIEKRLAIHDHYQENPLDDLALFSKPHNKGTVNSPIATDRKNLSNQFNDKDLQKSLLDQLKTEKLISSQLSSWLRVVKGPRASKKIF
ncbi:uncharacterized protein TRIADDRAFT_53302 [Trichoplax adhaerens]|uniref:Uncharacterized protein n=1 Tax=Trichoplax adhaerens TaxID=10228 RepID=B3RNV4_TRIAD|nr:predicted protein [Trichoplax adhaerens]EDV28078.1 predicted protein [Trichoplax adhaerens]|eukprot:XP_002109912.1 predicted protein [Trichoplax adhaerens]